MNITATHIAYYHLCQRKLWLFHHGIQMEHESDLVKEGKLIHESAYPQRAKRWQEISLEGIKIDYYDAKQGIVHEIKKTSKKEKAHIAQVKYYLYVLKKHGLKAEKGILEYPKTRTTQEVYLDTIDQETIPMWIQSIENIISADCPMVINKPMCKKCAYYEFCYIKNQEA